MGLEMFIKKPVSQPHNRLMIIKTLLMFFFFFAQENRLPTINAISVPNDLSEPYRVNAYANKR